MNYQLISEPNKEKSAIENVLINRGIKEKDIEHYLYTTKEDNLSPLLIARIQDGAKMLLRHLKLNNRIYFIVDSDMDGFCACALFLNYLHKFIPSFNNYSYNFHRGKEHGIDLSLVDYSANLIVALDSSSNDYEEHAILSNQSKDILVIDHHMAEKVSEHACIINNQLCDYPTKSLSGGAMVYKFCQYLDLLTGNHYADELVDLAAASIISDIMDLRDFETREIVKQGLNNIRNPYLQGMIDKNSYSIGKEVTPTGIAFYVAPYVNSVTRVGTQEEKKILFEAMLEDKAYNFIPSTKRGCKGQEETILTQALRMCANTKKHQDDEKKIGVSLLKTQIENNNLLNHKLLLIQVDDKINPNIRGLIANNLMSEYKRPCAVLSRTIKDNNVYWEGSARGYSKCELTDFRTLCKNTELIEYAEGHNQAFGLSIPQDNFNLFLKTTDEILKNIDFSPNYNVDFINCNPQTIIEIAKWKELWGQQIEEPYIAMENIKISKDNITLMSKDKNPTLKITLDNGVACIKFKSSEEEYKSLYSDSGCVIVSLVGRCAINEWMGQITPQILIDDYEIITREEYYF